MIRLSSHRKERPNLCGLWANPATLGLDYVDVLARGGYIVFDGLLSSRCVGTEGLSVPVLGPFGANLNLISGYPFANEQIAKS